jgi:hypothetical protein
MKKTQEEWIEYMINGFVESTNDWRWFWNLLYILLILPALLLLMIIFGL